MINIHSANNILYKDLVSKYIHPTPRETDEYITDITNHKYLASIVYKNYNYLTIDHTILDKTVVSRSFITNVLDYCFLKRNMIRSFVKSDNIKSIKFMRQLGFVEEGCFRQYFDDGCDYIIFSMTFDEWKNNPHRRLDNE